MQKKFSNLFIEKNRSIFWIISHMWHGIKVEMSSVICISFKHTYIWVYRYGICTKMDSFELHERGIAPFKQCLTTWATRTWLLNLRCMYWCWCLSLSYVKIQVEVAKLRYKIKRHSWWPCRTILVQRALAVVVVQVWLALWPSVRIDMLIGIRIWTVESKIE